ncbi:peptide deformylase [bacterium]|nr:peptide deformylase [bacterium]MBU1072146.1 peptide deformylase [bacterium]MBU1676148.1 peptide deformylase [bacterium]
MAILKVARMGHPVLRRLAETIPPEDITGPEVQTLIRDLLETMREYAGVGLAAPQVHVSKQLALVGGELDEEDEPIIRVVINPVITPTTGKLYGMYEGCLSVPGLRGWVERPAAIHVVHHDMHGERVERELEGFAAVVMQHECDHLRGVLYVDRLKDIRKLAFEEEAERFLPIERMIDERDL